MTLNVGILLWNICINFVPYRHKVHKYTNVHKEVCIVHIKILKLSGIPAQIVAIVQLKADWPDGLYLFELIPGMPHFHLALA